MAHCVCKECGKWKEHYANGYCRPCYMQRQPRRRGICFECMAEMDYREKEIWARGRCKRHYLKWWRKQHQGKSASS